MGIPKTLQITDQDIIRLVAQVQLIRGNRTLAGTACDLLRERITQLQTVQEPARDRTEPSGDAA